MYKYLYSFNFLPPPHPITLQVEFFAISIYPMWLKILNDTILFQADSHMQQFTKNS